MSLTPVQSISGSLHKILENVTPLSTDTESKLDTLIITARVVGGAALLVASAIETAVRYLIAFGGLAISFALKDGTKDNFKQDYVTPAFNYAKSNKDAFFAIKEGLVISYETHIKPFLQNKVDPPSS